MRVWQRTAGVRRVGISLGLCLVLLFGGAAPAAADSTKPERQASPALLDLWFVLQESGPVYAPYAFIRHTHAAAMVSARKDVLLTELKHLVWHLNATGRAALADHLGQWRQHIRQSDAYRTPGHWGPAALLSGARNGVPVSAVAAIGACRVPDWVEVWSAQGVQRVDWRPGMHLSSLLFDNGLLSDTQAQRVTLVTPYGRRLKRGIGAWNFNDMPLSPGMRIVVPLPLDGEVAPWMRRHLSSFLAHLVPGDACRQMVLKHGSTHGSD